MRSAMRLHVNKEPNDDDDDTLNLGLNHFHRQIYPKLLTFLKWI